MGVFVASSRSDYDIRNSRDLMSKPQFNALGVAPTMFANRLSYHYDLQGPSLATDTACVSEIYKVLLRWYFLLTDPTFSLLA